MAVRFSQHVSTRLTARGTTEQEVRETLARGLPDRAYGDREAKAMVVPFGTTWGGRRYEQKKIRAIYKVEGADTVVITVYVYYGSWP